MSRKRVYLKEEIALQVPCCTLVLVELNCRSLKTGSCEGYNSYQFRIINGVNKNLTKTKYTKHGESCEFPLTKLVKAFIIINMDRAIY